MALIFSSRYCLLKLYAQASRLDLAPKLNNLNIVFGLELFDVLSSLSPNEISESKSLSVPSLSQLLFLSGVFSSHLTLEMLTESSNILYFSSFLKY